MPNRMHSIAYFFCLLGTFFDMESHFLESLATFIHILISYEVDRTCQNQLCYCQGSIRIFICIFDDYHCLFFSFHSNLNQ